MLAKVDAKRRENNRGTVPILREPRVMNLYGSFAFRRQISHIY
jgi:hypothetical protein